ADTIAARHFLDPVSAGRYSATATVLHGALYGAQALTAALLPSFATRNLRNSRTALTRALLGTAILTIPAMVLLTLVGPRLIPLVLGATFQVSTDVIALVAVATTGLALLWVLVQHAMASSRHGANIVWLGLPLVVGGAALWHTQMWTLAAVTVVAVAVPLALLGWRSLIARPPATGRVPERWRDAVPFACTNGGHSTATAYDKMKRFHEEPSDSYRGRADQERREDVGTMPGKRESPDISLC
ncbi:MAG: hypothetical protein HKP61_09675, partial [Dactylosporangium sp.]|nr:hypothetical protein [Dactylosporangium sp.]NNJ61201.1 hypothetical protein [Dactylosporangium sp.]